MNPQEVAGDRASPVSIEARSARAVLWWNRLRTAVSPKVTIVKHPPYTARAYRMLRLKTLAFPNGALGVFDERVIPFELRFRALA